LKQALEEASAEAVEEACERSFCISFKISSWDTVYTIYKIDSRFDKMWKDVEVVLNDPSALHVPLNSLGLGIV